MQGTVVVIGGDAIKNFTRLGGNLIMTRLLYPEAFGLMLIITFIQTGLVLLSDTGVRDAIIVKSRGRETEFVNTAWVITILRGFILSIATLILAWPVAQFYGQPELFYLMLISALAPLFQGFASPRRFLYVRDVKLTTNVMVEVMAQAITLTIGITVLYFYPTVYVLGAMGALGSLVLVILSFIFFKGGRPKFKLDKPVAKEMFNFGKWIFLATALTFLAAEGDKIIFSTLFTTAQLGVFSIAIALAKVVESVAQSVSGKLLIPVYASISQAGSQGIDKKTRKIKLGMCGIFIPPILFLSLFGGWLIDVLFDDRYRDAGWMLQVISVGAIFSVFSHALASVITGKGDVKAQLLLHLFKVIVYFSILLGAGFLFGTTEMIYGLAIAPFFIYLGFSIYVIRYGIYALKTDILIFAIVLATIFAFWNILGWPASFAAS